MIKKIIPLVIIAILIATFWLSGVSQHLNLDRLVENKDLLISFINDHFTVSIIGFGLLYATIVALSLPFASLMTLSGGFLFGLIWGGLIVSISATLGATIIFLIAKTSFGTFLREKAGTLYSRVEQDTNENAVSYLLFLRLVPLFPFFLVNILPALFNVKTRTYIITTFLGILPGTLVYVNVGRSLGEVENPSDLISSDIIIAIALLGVFAIIPVIYQKYRKRKNAAK